MEIQLSSDVDKFLDKFQDPTLEVELVMEAYEKADDDVKSYFIHRLLMKAYRLGKEHAYATSLDAIRR
jgi:hypothetical protein